MSRRTNRIILWTVGMIAVSFLLSAVYYLVFALIFSSETDNRLRAENRLYRRYLPEVRSSVALLDDELDYLSARDADIYKEVFKADAPSVSRLLEGDVLVSEQYSDDALLKRASRQSMRAMKSMEKTEECWKEIFDSLSSAGFVMPPMLTPVENLHYSNVGASVGDKMNPFLKIATRHEGLDIVAPAMTPVIATAPGVVTKVQSNLSGHGNQVEISHSGGYVTRYYHLAQMSVKKGQKVKAGTEIGKIGDSGRSFTTHLHYEVERNGVKLDPNNFFFGNIKPDEYVKFMIMSSSSGQSMD